MLRGRTIKVLFGSLILINNISSIFSQDKAQLKAWFVEAESFFLFEEYKDALPLYHKILRAEKNNYNVQYKIGICYLNDIYQKKKSIQYLKEASENINMNFKYDSFREKLAPPEALYYLGMAYQINTIFDMAIEKYWKFLQIADPDEFDFELVHYDIEACQRAKKAYSNPGYFRPDNVGEVINSRFEETNPVISGNGKVFVFTRKLQFYDGIFICYRNDDGSWTAPYNLTGDFALDGNSYTTGLSYFGDEIYVYRSDNYDGNIYRSKRIGEKWMKLEKLNDNINSKYWESHASPSPDGQFLYFTSNREGGYGGLDIYKSRRSTSGDWGKAVNLGPVVNSPGNEETPFLSNEGYTLFFSSDGHNTIGGYDIYISRLMPDGNWDSPLNMGYPLNSSGNDLFYCPTGADAIGYYAYYNPKLSLGLRDVFKVEVYNEKIPRIFTLNGSVDISKLQGRAYEKIKIKLYATSGHQKTTETSVDKDGTFKLKAQQGDYILRIESPNIETYQQSLSLAVNQDESNIKLPDIALNTIQEPVEEDLPLTGVVETEIPVKEKYITITDGGKVPIELTLEKGSELVITTIMGDTVYSEQLLTDLKRKFVYFHEPLPGENKLVLRATDKSGKVSGTEIIIQYNQIEPKVGTIPVDTVAYTPMAFNSDQLLKLAPEDLFNQLKPGNRSGYSNAGELYQYLISQIDTSDTELVNKLNKLFSTYYSQRKLVDFKNDFITAGSFPDSVIRACADSSAIPLEFLGLLESNQAIEDADIYKALLTMLLERNNQSPDELYNVLGEFSVDNNSNTTSEQPNQTVQQAWNEYVNKVGKSKAIQNLKNASTSEDLNFLYQNLLFGSSGRVHDYLAKLNLEKEGIRTAPELVQHLFNNVSDTTFTLQELLEALENAQKNKGQYLKVFQDALTAHSQGNLKSELVLMQNDIADKETYENYLNYLLNQAQFKNYSRESVYNMLLDLINITNLDEFAEKIISYGYGQINNAIADTSLKYFSNPFELVQYLVSASQSYDFTASDINNLLIRMILEKGLDNARNVTYDEETPEKIWKKKEFITSIISVNIILIILIILFTFRRRKDKDE